MKKQGHWYEFYIHRLDRGEFDKDVDMTVRMFVNSAREGIFAIRQDYPYAWVYEYERLDIKK